MAWFAGRFKIVDGAPVPASDPAGYSVPTGDPVDGGRVDLCTGSGPPLTSYATPGAPVLVDTGGSFSAGDPIATDAQGRAVQATSGDRVVAEAIEGSSGFGETAWVKFVAQHTL